MRKYLVKDVDESKLQAFLDEHAKDGWELISADRNFSVTEPLMVEEFEDALQGSSTFKVIMVQYEVTTLEGYNRRFRGELVGMSERPTSFWDRLWNNWFSLT